MRLTVRRTDLEKIVTLKISLLFHEYVMLSEMETARMLIQCKNGFNGEKLNFFGGISHWQIKFCTHLFPQYYLHIILNTNNIEIIPSVKYIYSKLEKDYSSISKGFQSTLSVYVP